MLQTEHETTSYAKPMFRRQPPEIRQFRQVLERILPFAEVRADLAAIHLTDSECAGIDDFLRQHEAIRHRLLLRKVRGEELTSLEEAVLSELNSELERYLPLPVGRTAAETAAVEEAKRILAGLEHADT